ncbi:MAG: hypothetical protein V3U44_09560 [Alphaproteobacteria bacterium]
MVQSGAMTRAEFLEKVAKAEKRARKRRRPRVMAEASLDALAAARAADPLRGVRAARLVPRCGKVKTTPASRPVCAVERAAGTTVASSRILLIRATPVASPVVSSLPKQPIELS